MNLWTIEPIRDEDFAKMIEEGFLRIPEHLRAEVDNVALTYADLPSIEQLARKDMHRGQAYDLLGLYEGVPLTERGVNYGFVLPDRITIFKLPLMLYSSQRGQPLLEAVSDTVWHEYAHHFGWNDAAIHVREEHGDNHSV